MKLLVSLLWWKKLSPKVPEVLEDTETLSWFVMQDLDLH